MHPKRFLGIVIGCCMAAIMVMVAVNWSVDPTGLLQAAGVRDAQTCPQGLGGAGDEITIKTLGAHYFRPKTLLVGTSQVAVGFNRDALPAAWSEERIFNLGLPAATLGTIGSVLPFAISGGETERVVMGLTPNMTQAMWNTEDRSDFTHGWIRRFLMTSLFSADAIRESLRLLAGKRTCRDPKFQPDGFRMQKSISFLWKVPDEPWFRRRIEPYIRSGKAVYDRDYMIALFGHLCDRGIEANIALLPGSLEWQIMYWTMPGGWAWIERFKYDVMEAADVLGKSGCTVTVHDFNVIEASFPVGSQSSGSMFLDYLHFVPALGRGFLHRIAAGDTADSDTAIGLRLHAENISAHLAAQRAQMQKLTGRLPAD